MLLARTELAINQPHAAEEHLHAIAPGALTPRRRLELQLLLSASAIARGDHTASDLVSSVLQAAYDGRYLNTVITSAPQLTNYLIEHSTSMRSDSFAQQLTAAALDTRAAAPPTGRSGDAPFEPVTAAELRVLRLLPTSTYPQIAANLHISLNTVKTHLRSIYQKLAATSRSQAIERAIDLRLL